ncbi:MAG: DUF4328 domain-containing protein, partial [Jatrophihabitantaceae bacterium]
LVDGDRSVSLADAAAADDRASTAGNVSLVVTIAAGIAFTLWFWQVRHQAGRYDPRRQRRSQGWAFWGWIVPVVSLWFPYQIASDAVQSTPGDHAGTMRIVRVWWAFWVLSLVINRVPGLLDPKTLNAFKSQTSIEIAAAAAEIIAGALAIVAVARIARTLDGYREALLRG